MERPNQEGARQALLLPISLEQVLKRLSRQENVSLFMTLLAAFKTLLHRYTAQTDLLIATPLAGRNCKEVEGVIGNFANIVALRTNLSGNPSFRELLQRVRDVTLDAQAHGDLPLALLAEALRAQRVIDKEFPFEIMFNLRNFPAEPFEFTGLRTAEVEFDPGFARFDLSVDVLETPYGLSCLFEYDTARFDSETIARLGRDFHDLLEAIVANPDQPIGISSFQNLADGPLSDNFSHRSPRDGQRHRGIHHLFEEQAARTPNAIAVTYDGSGLTYGALNRRTNQLAHYLRTLGVRPGTLVGMCLERSVEMLIGMLGILKAGGAYVPLDPQYPKERLAYMLEDAQPTVLLTQERFVQKPAEERGVENGAVRSSMSVLGELERISSQSKVVCLDRDWPAIANKNHDDPTTDIQSDHPAYVIYTSGSTGRPKGVLIMHGGVINHSLAVSRHFGLQSGDRVAHCASINFDISVEEIFPTWATGATVVLCPPDLFFPGQDWARWIAEEEITVLNLPTAFWHEWVNEIGQSYQSLPPGLRLVVVGGEQAAPQALIKWKRFGQSHVRWVNTYGPTEATVTTTIYEPKSEVEPQDTVAGISIGRSISNTETYVLDPYLHPVPLGIPGELCIGGRGLASGYLNQPDLTAAKFIPNPFARDPGARLYRTGDRVRCRPDGNLEFLGRLDHQVKIRGFRVEPGEIEAVLRAHPRVHDAIVLVQEDKTSQKRDAGDPNTPARAIEKQKLDVRLVGYVVPRPELPLTRYDLRAYLKQKLPEYMVPSAFMFLDRLPLTPNGKIDRKALPVPDQNRPELQDMYVAPRTPLEDTIVKIWAELLQLEKVGIQDNFFELGGHSLKATQVISRLRQVLRIDLPLRAIFEAPTVAQLSERIVMAKTDEAETAELANMLAELAPLSDDEAERLAAEEQQ